MSYHSYCRVLIFYFVLFEKLHSYNAEYSKINDNKSETNSKYISYGTFKIFFKKNTWMDAVSYCNRNDMNIGEVKTINDARSLSETMLKNRPNSIESAWIGGYMNKINRENGVWRWFSNDEALVNDSGLWFRQSELESKSNSESEPEPQSYCLLLDWHLDTNNNPAYVKAPCDRKREVICEEWDTPRILSNGDTSTNADFKKFITPTTEIIPSNVAPAYRSKTKVTSKMKSSSTVKKNKKIKNQKLKGIMRHSSRSTTTTTTTSTTTIRTTTEEEYPDDKMWELGKKQMGSRRNETVKRIENETSNVSRRYYEFLREIQDLNSRMTARKRKKKPQSTLMPLKPLRLYYAFEGPMVAGLTVTPLPHDEFDGEMKVVSGPRYQKYINRQKYYELMLKKQRNN